MVDNYDSFTYNLVALLQQCGQVVTTIRSDAASPQSIMALNPKGIVLSPGPGKPEEAGHCPQIVHALGGIIPILGVCLGHQVIAQVYGAMVTNAMVPVHGKTSAITHTGVGVFAGLPQSLQVMRYHSLVVAQRGLPPDLIPTAWTGTSPAAEQSELMGLRHAHLPVQGIQFHPESVLTPMGLGMLQNWVAGLAH
jgi:anthranilate synthase component 2